MYLLLFLTLVVQMATSRELNSRYSIMKVQDKEDKDYLPLIHQNKITVPDRLGIQQMLADVANNTSSEVNGSLDKIGGGVSNNYEEFKTRRSVITWFQNLFSTTTNRAPYSIANTIVPPPNRIPLAPITAVPSFVANRAENALIGNNNLIDLLQKLIVELQKLNEHLRQNQTLREKRNIAHERLIPVKIQTMTNVPMTELHAKDKDADTSNKTEALTSNRSTDINNNKRFKRSATDDVKEDDKAGPTTTSNTLPDTAKNNSITDKNNDTNLNEIDTTTTAKPPCNNSDDLPNGRRYMEPPSSGSTSEVKTKLLEYIDTTFKDIFTKLEPLQEIKLAYSNNDAYKIGYISANVDTLDASMKNMKKDLDASKDTWGEKRVLEMFDKLMMMNKVVASLTEALNKYKNNEGNLLTLPTDLSSMTNISPINTLM